MINTINIPRGISKSAALILFVAVTLPTGVAAQDEGAVVLEEVVVTGYRQSLRAAQELKREAVGSQDSIVAEDLADFPDLNLADALQRVPGIAITRDQGEGRQISLRGLGPDFTTVYLNGMEGLATTASALDARGSVSRSRAFDFNIFSADLFKQIDVKKSYQASLEEGGIGGNVALTTAKPFDNDGFTAAFSGQLGQNDQADDTDTKFTAIVSNTWDKFGALVSLSYSERNTEEQGYNGFRWRQRSLANSQGINPAIDQDIQDAFANNEIFFNRGNRHSVWQNEQERIGITGSLQFKPTDDLSFSLDALVSELNNDRTEYHISTGGGSSSTALGFVDALEIIPAPDGDGFEAVYGEFSQIAATSETRQDRDTTDFEQFTLTADWNVTDQLLVKALIGTSSSDFRLDNEKFYIETEAIYSVVTDHRGPLRFDPITTFTDVDITDSANFSFREIDINERDIKNEYDNIKIDAEYTFSDDNLLKFGVSTREFSNFIQQTRLQNIGRIDGDGNPNGDAEAPQNQDVRNIDDLTFVFTDHNSLDYIGGNVQGALDFYGVNTDLAALGIETRPSALSNVEEETTNAYVQYDWTSELSGKRFRGNIGLRYYDTEVTTSGVVGQDNTPVTLVSGYDGVLPTLNVAWDLSDDWVLRGSIAQNVTRPSLGSLALGGSVDTGDAGSVSGTPTIRAGNPGLEPFESTNIDASLEWYFGDAGALAIGLFYKDIDNFIISETVSIPYGETGFPLEFLDPGQDANTLFDLSRPINGDSTDIKGAEIAYQTDLTFLPQPFDSLGIQTNYTYADGEFLFENIQGQGVDQTKSFPGLSEHTANFTLYYETDVWGARISSVYRSEFITDGDGVGSDSDESGNHATTHVDFSSFYEVNDNMKLTLDAVNLTDEKEEIYTDSSDRLQNLTTAGTSVFLGLSYRF